MTVSVTCHPLRAQLADTGIVTTETLTEPRDGDEIRSSRQTVARLVFLADLEDPDAPSTSHSLDGVDEVRFRRGDRGAHRRERVLTLSYPDVRMSSEHGRLIRVERGWTLDDPGSKNGTLVDGVMTRRMQLPSTALLELGRTFVWFAESECTLPGHLSGDVSADALRDRPRGMATFSPDLAHLFDQLARIAALPVPILLLGDTGTGKEVIAAAIHELSRRGGDFVAVNCGALPPTLIESELFGHRKGAFSGASADRRGFVRTADSGTLFLDEVGELPASSQTAFLRVLQEHQVIPVGDDRAVDVDLRVVSATLRDLDDAIDAGQFRADLYARLAGHVVTLPALCERREDFGLLLANLAAQRGSPFRFSPPALRALVRHPWPRNIRELEQVLTTAAGLADGRIELEHLPEAVRSPQTLAGRAAPSPVQLDDADRELRERLISLFEQHNGNVVVVAEVMGKQRQQIYKWIKRLSIDLSAFRRA